MEGGLEFNAFEFDDFEPNIDDSEDFNLGSTENSKRFGPPLSENALDQAISDRIPKKTQKTTQWAVSVFHSWCDDRGVKNATENMAIEVLVDLLPRFIMEARRGRLVKEMCEHAGFSSRYTNHSGKVTCATELFAHNATNCCEGIQEAWCSTYVGFQFGKEARGFSSA